MNTLRNHHVLQLVVLLLIVTLLGGCWDYSDIDERLFVLMIGVDVKDGGYLVSAQITIPLSTGTQPTAGGAGGAGAAAPKPYRVVSAEGPTVRDALDVLNGETYRELDFGQLLVTVVSEELAKKGLNQLDYIVRSGKVQLTGFIAVSRTTAADVLNATTPAEVVPAGYLYKAYQQVYTRSPEVMPISTWEALLQRLRDPLLDVFAPGVATHPFGINFAGVALFRDGHLVGWLDPHDTAVLNTIMRQKMAGNIPVEDPRFGKLDARIDRGTVSYETMLDGETPVLKVNLTLFVELSEAPTLDVRSVQVNNEVSAVLSLAAQQHVEALLRRLQELQTDPLGFGERLRRNNPRLPMLASATDWRQAYAEATTDVKVRVVLTTRGRHE